MVDAKQLIPMKRFLESQQDKIKLFSIDQPEQIHIYHNIGRVTKIETKTLQEQKSNTSIGFFALYGIIQLKNWSYLLLVTEANMVGQILQRTILQVEQISFLPLVSNGRLNDIHADDQTYCKMLKEVFSTKTLYFSYEYDLSNPFDKVMGNNSQFGTQQKTSEGLHYYKIPNYRFVYNWEHIKFLNQFQSTNLPALQYWQTIFISGCVLIRYCKLNQQSDCFLILVSRRETLRSGRRFVQRGCDQDGNCTNFAETEQILILNKQESRDIYSFVQTRGSMPFNWQQQPTLKWAPKATIIGDRSYNSELCKKHFEKCAESYQQLQIILNLIDKKGTQKMLGEYFTSMISSVKTVKTKYVWFDFHHECRNMKYENLSKLLNEIKEDIKKSGYFHAEIDKNNYNILSNIHSQQSGVVRTNCMDCLDRTNVVQSVVSRNFLLHILNQANIIHTLTGEALQVLPNDLEQIFRDQWTKNADIMSVLYSGTGALKTDFTRTGKRTFWGSLQDGKNSLHRYYINNFVDAHNQNCIDLALGKLDADKINYKKSKFNGVLQLFIFIIILMYIMTSFLPGLILDDSSTYRNSCLIKLFIYGISLFITSKILLKTHYLFISKPIRDQN
ncbi:unnamed protein product [Paramecium primaurelia]|uniref:SAC domain-containing protein n=1 Tax=Paramecium primaurelia TaxID=5886 RepID=A0A8S1QNK1_PARPR|nr:unnamed protein product [Paramecium primaurelia]